MGIFCMFVVIGLLFMFALLLACHKLYRDTEKELQETKEKLIKMTEMMMKKQGSNNQNQPEKPIDDMPKGSQNTIVKEHRERGEENLE